MNIKTSIRNHLVTTLAVALGIPVIANRPDAVDTEEPETLFIYSGAEEPEPSTQISGVYKRSYQIVHEIRLVSWHEGHENLDETLDDYQEALEDALKNFSIDAVHEVNLVSVGAPEVDNESEVYVASQKFTFEFIYFK